MKESSCNSSCPLCNAPIKTIRHAGRVKTLAICKDCGLWFRTPRPTPKELKAIYNKDYYDTWALQENPELTELSKQKTFACVLEKIDTFIPNDNTSRSLLDIGAATGHFISLAKAKKWSVFALEANPFSLDILRNKLGNDHVFCDSITNVTLEERSLDVITMFDAIEHIPNIETLLRESHRLLKGNGILCITTPRIDSYSRLFMRKNWPHYKEEHIQYFSKQCLKATLQKHGFEVKTTRGHTKWLHFCYLNAQFQAYRHWFFTPVFNYLDRILPKKIKQIALPYRCGEMLMIAQKNTKEGIEI